MGRVLKTGLTLCLVLGMTATVLGQREQTPQRQQPPPIFGPGALLFNPNVQKDLKLSKEQVGKLQESLEKVMAKYKEDFDKFRKSPPSEEQADKVSKAFNEDSLKAINGVLDARQVKRFKQIEWQLNGIGALQDPELQKELKLSDEQKKKLSSIFQDAEKKFHELAQKRETSREKYEAVGKDAEKRVNAVLSEEQRKSFEELKGPKFEVSSPAPPPREKE